MTENVDTDDDFSCFSQNDLIDENSNLNDVLVDMFDSTQSKPAEEKSTVINVETKKKISCKPVLILKNPFKPFIYPSPEDILIEMGDTVNLNSNCSSIQLHVITPLEEASEAYFSDSDFEVFTQTQTRASSSMVKKYDEVNSNISIEPKYNIAYAVESNNFANCQNEETVDLDNSISLKNVMSKNSFDIESKGDADTPNIFTVSGTSNYTVSKSDNINNNIIPSYGFKSGKGVEISISDNARKTARELINVNDDKELILPIITKKQSLQEETSVITESLKSAADIDISKSKVVRNNTERKVAQSYDNLKCLDIPILNSSKDVVSRKPTSSKLVSTFKSASGSNILISENALNQGRKVIDKIENESNIRFDSPTYDFVNDNAKNMLATLTDSNSTNDIDNKNKISTLPISIGFKSAMGHAIPVSNDAIEAAKKMLEEIKESESTLTVDSSVTFKNIESDLCKKRKDNNVSVSEENRIFKGQYKNTMIQRRFTSPSDANVMEDYSDYEPENSELESNLFSEKKGHVRKNLKKIRLESSVPTNAENTSMNATDQSSIEYNIDYVVSFEMDKTNNEVTNAAEEELSKVETTNDFDSFTLSDESDATESSESFPNELSIIPLTTLSPAYNKKVRNYVHVNSTPIKKRTMEIRPSAGLFYRIKHSGQRLFSMKDLVKGVRRDNASSSIDGLNFTVTYDNCCDLNFIAKDCDCILQIGDGAVMFSRQDNMVTADMFVEDFLKSPDVDSKLISKEWVKNHYQLILWKLLTFYNYCSPCLSPNWVSPHHIMLQLKYRYDKEIDDAQRPALRKIAEQDDTAGKRLVLVIVSIERKGSDIVQMKVSDGWYCVPALIDLCIKNQISKGRIKVGTKLITSNAIWQGFEGPVVLPCSGFPPSCGLRLHGNSTRRARNYAKLGYQRNSLPFPVAIGSLNTLGGVASLISVVINRVYPMQFMETVFLPNQEKPRRIFRSQRAEQAAQKDFEQFKDNIVNKAVNSLCEIGSHTKKQKLGSPNELQSGEDILHWLNNSMDQETVVGQLTHAQQETLRAYKEQIVNEEISNKCPNRNVITVARLLVKGLHPSDVDTKLGAMLTIWKPSDELMSLLSEGCAVKIYSVLVNHSKVDIHSTINNCPTAINTTSTTRFERDISIHENLIDKIYRPRQLLSVNEVYQFLSNSAKSCEIDCVGIVTAISKVNSLTSDCWQVIILSNPESQTDDLVTIKLWGGLQSNFLVKIVEVGNCVKFSNLQFRTLFKNQDNINKQDFVPECHYSQYSNAHYENKYNYFYKVKDHLNAIIRKRLPWFQNVAPFQSSQLLQSKSINLCSPNTPQRIGNLNSYIRDKNRTDNPLLSAPSLASSTPKRLGLSSKRASVSTDVTKSFVDDSVSVSNIVDNNETDGDLNTSIADVVKTQRRLSTILGRYSADSKRNKKS